MDLLTISGNDYSAHRLVEGYRSLIWTERFQKWGDFELHTEDIRATMDLLPERSLCSLLDSNEVMMVDSHEISKPTGGVPELVVRGRSIDAFLENRVWTNNPQGKTTITSEHYNAMEMAAVWLWNSIVNDTEQDVFRPGTERPIANVLPNTIVTVTVPYGTLAGNEEYNLRRKVENGNVYDLLTTFLTSARLGIRIIRPNDTSGRKVSVSSEGVFSTVYTSNIENLRFDLHKGRDLTETVVFSSRVGHLIDPTYLLSSESLKNYVIVKGSPGNSFREYGYSGISGRVEGWNRREIYVDAGEAEELTQGEDETDEDFEIRKNAQQSQLYDTYADLADEALRNEGRHISTIDAQISPFINYKYNKDYRLGDRVKVQGDYGIHADRYVTEFIRAQDENGEVEYPTLEDTFMYWDTLD